MATAQKDMRGNWRAEDYTLTAGGKTLHILTCKTASGHINTTVQAGVKTPGSFAYMAYDDWRRGVASTRPVRVTKGAVEAQHAMAMASVAQFRLDADAHYDKGVV